MRIFVEILTTITLSTNSNQITKPNMQNQIQQGDVILRRIKSLPSNAAPIKKDPRGIVLAEGEVTGHCHRIASNKAQLFSKDNQMFLEVSQTAQVTHEEHNPVTIEPGIWEVGQVNEYDYFTQMMRKVVD